MSEKHIKLTKNGLFALVSQLNKRSRGRPSYKKMEGMPGNQEEWGVGLWTFRHRIPIS